jgi:hypothetical protein
MKRKAAKKAKPAAPKKQAKAPQQKPLPHAAPQAGVSEMVAASAAALGLKVDPAWEANVAFNLQLILRHAALVDEFALPDDAEPAPVFCA